MTLLAGRYTLDVPLGDSDLGTVWNAHDDTGPLVVVTLEDDAPEPQQARFRAHAKALVATQHPNLVRALAEGEENGVPYLVLERLAGASLGTRLDSGPALTVARVVEIVTLLAEALAVVHAAGIAHGDVEPGNVLLVTEGGKEIPKLIGFALNRASLRQELGARTSVPSLGPVAYAAPEQARGEVMESALADQASLAALVYAALGGRPPHIARDPAALATAIGSEKPPLLTMAKRELAPFASTIDRALSTDPKKRFADIGAFGRALKTAGSMARAIATSPVPLGARSGIGEPPAPSLPKAATIPRPAGAMGSRPGAKALAIPRPGAAAVPKPDGTAGARTTQELEVGDLMPATGQTALAPVVAAAAAPPAAIAIAPPSAITSTATPQPPPKAPPPLRTTEDLDASELQTPSDPPPAAPRDSMPEVEARDLISIPPPAAPPPPPAAHPAANEAAAEPEDSTAEPERIEKPDPALLEGADGVTEIPAAAMAMLMAAQPEAKPAEAKPPPPPAPPKAAPVASAEDASVRLSPSMEKIVVAAAKQEASKPKPKPSTAAPIASMSLPPPAIEEDAPAARARPAWMLPAAIAAVVVLAIASWFSYHAMSTQTPPPPAGHTLAVAPPDETSVPVTTVPVPPTSVVIAPPPTTTIALRPPPTTRLIVPPSTGTARPPTTGTARPPTTGTARPPGSGRPPATGTRPAPSTAARHPPPTTTTRPTVVSDPGF